MSTHGLTRKAAVEALIFASRNGIEPSKIARILEMKLGQVMILVDELEQEYKNSSDRGVILKNVNGRFRFYTRGELEDYVKQVSQRPVADITDSQMEVLAIVAVRGPATRSDIEFIRGRSCQAQLLELARMGLLRKRRSKQPGRPFMYRVTQRFYDTFQLSDLGEIIEGLEIPEKASEEDETSAVSAVEHEPVEEKGRRDDQERAREGQQPDSEGPVAGD